MECFTYGCSNDYYARHDRTITVRLFPRFIMLHTLKPAKGSRPPRKRIARGDSGKGGSTGGRGVKGQDARSGSKRHPGFEGGQTPLIRRQPKLGGFQNPNRKEYEVVNVGDLEEKLSAGSYDIDALRTSKLIRTKKPVKLLSRGDVQKKFALTVHAASASAKAAIEKAGGSVTLLTS